MKRLLFVAFVLFFLISTNAIAEDCSAIGCTGSVGYVFLSEAQYRNNQSEISLNGIKYKVTDSDRIFIEKGLPDINSVVTVNTSYYELFGVYDIKDDLKYISKKLVNWKDEEFDDKNKIVNLNAFQGSIGNRLTQGTKLKILGYRMVKEFIPETYFNHIIVLVKVVSEPDK